MLSVKRTGGMTLSQEEIPPTCLTGHAIDEYYILPAQFLQQEAGHPAPTLQIQLNELRNRIGDYPNLRTARAEFKSLQQRESEKIVDSEESGHRPMQL